MAEGQGRVRAAHSAAGDVAAGVQTTRDQPEAAERYDNACAERRIEAASMTPTIYVSDQSIQGPVDAPRKSVPVGHQERDDQRIRSEGMS